MTIALVTSGSSTNNAGAASLAPALPSSIVANNLLISWVGVNGTGKVFTPSAGWTLGDSINTGTKSSAWAWRVATGSDTACTFSWTGSAACGGQCDQFSGTKTVSPVVAFNKATADASVALTMAGVTTTANNSAILFIGTCDNNQTIATPADWTNAGFTPGTASWRAAFGFVGTSGKTSAAISVAVTSTNWNSFGIELVGPGGAATTGNVRDSQAIQQVLEAYSNATNVRASQVVKQVLESYSNPTNVRTSQVIISVLRAVASADGTTPCFAAYPNAPQSGITSGVQTALAAALEVYDVGGYYNPATGLWTPPAGIVWLGGTAFATGTMTAGSDTHYVGIAKNGTLIASHGGGSITNRASNGVYIIDNASGADTYGLVGLWTTTSGTVAVQPLLSGTIVTRFEGHWIMVGPPVSGNRVRFNMPMLGI